MKKHIDLKLTRPGVYYSKFYFQIHIVEFLGGSILQKWKPETIT